MSAEEANRTKLAKGLVPSINRDTGKINKKAKWISKKGSERKNTNKHNNDIAQYKNRNKHNTDITQYKT